MKTGILGSGQLARMIMEAGYKFGMEFKIISPEDNSPAGQLTKNEMIGDCSDEDCLIKFSEDCDIITLENEFTDLNKIKFLENLGKAVYPSSETIKFIQDKLFQKEYLKKSGIPLANFTRVDSVSDIISFASENSYPVVLKSRTMGYDGKGNFTVTNKEEAKEAFDKLSGRGELMCESFVRFEKEIATQVVRNKKGEIKVYPVVETIQKDHICNMVIASKNIWGELQKEAESIAVKIVTDKNYIGVMGIEMFLIKDKIIVNELAPRVHNSGHYTIEGCYTSQFENHIRAIYDLPLGNCDMNCENAVMINVLGKRNGKSELKNAGKVLMNENVYLHIYGKKNTGTGRKMGHITVLNNDLGKAIEIANKCNDEIEI
ncbi:MAG TPA: 5-(carboxyamino)imidazole ribonucleotide synthase [Ignavibacteria bacterium]|nr:5-(carboxyamino)imidazole ribonucleotide synthase [Ignavibacteria bacterium]